MIPKEEAAVVISRLTYLNLNNPGAVAATDCGIAWLNVVIAFNQIQVEDTWHSSENRDSADLIDAGNRGLRCKFKDDMYRALYDVMKPSELDALLEEMLNTLVMISPGHSIGHLDCWRTRRKSVQPIPQNTSSAQ